MISSDSIPSISQYHQQNHLQSNSVQIGIIHLLQNHISDKVIKLDNNYALMPRKQYRPHAPNELML